MTTEKSMIDPQVIASFCADLGEETCAALYQAFDEELAESLAGLSSLLEGSLDRPAALETLHKLKGTAASYSANALAQGAEEAEGLIEAKAKDETLRSALQLVVSLAKLTRSENATLISESQ